MTLEHPESDNWKTKPLAYYEWCWCGCTLTGGDVSRYGLDPGAQHSNSMINTARLKYLKAVATPLTDPVKINWSIGDDTWNMKIT